jgi:putative cardiolipin synthase
MDLRRVPLTWAPARLLVDKPDKIGPDDDETDASDTVVDGLLALMLQARQDILIISPYFVPGAADDEDLCPGCAHAACASGC